MSERELSEFMDWLFRTGVVTKDFMTNLWTFDNPLDYFFEDLREGIILVKLGKLLSSKIERGDYFLQTDGATFRREKNIFVFLEVCSSQRIKKHFTPQDLESDVNRYGVFQTLRAFSEKLEKKMKSTETPMPKFTKIPIKNEKKENITSNYKVGDISYYKYKLNTHNKAYQNYFERYSRVDEIYNSFFTYDLNTSDNINLDDSSPVHRKILELRRKESSYQKKFLRFFKKIVSQNSNTNDFFLGDVLSDIENVLIPVEKIHREFRDKLLKSVNPGPVFESFKLNFWIYGRLAILLINAESLIEDFQNDNLSKLEIKSLKEVIRKTQETGGDSTFPGTLDQLFQMPMRHICSYVILLSTIADTARKELENTTLSSEYLSNQNAELVKIVDSCQKAAMGIGDVVHFVDYSVKENSDKKIVRDFGNRLSSYSGISSESLANDHGALVFEGKIMYRWQKDKHFSCKFLICLQKLLLICDIKYRNNGRTSYFPIHAIKIFDPNIRLKVISVSSPSEVIDLKILCMDSDLNVFDDVFFLRSKTSKRAEELKEILESTFNLSRISSKYHPKLLHDYAVHECVQKELNIPKICGLPKCSKILYGRFVVGVYCKTCSKYYHSYCFENNTPEAYEEDIDLVTNLSKIRKSIDSEDENVSKKPITIDEVEFMEVEEFKKNIRNKPIGSCLLYSINLKKGEYKLAFRDRDNNGIAQVSKLLVINDTVTKRWRIDQTTQNFPTSDKVLGYLKKELSLKFIHKTGKGFSNESGESSQASGGSSENHPIDIEHLLSYSDRKTALKGKPPGTYLLYSSSMDSSIPYVISAVGPQGKLRSLPIQVIYDENNKPLYSVQTFSSGKKFLSISSLISNYKEKCQLLHPINSKQTEKTSDLWSLEEAYFSERSSSDSTSYSDYSSEDEESKLSSDVMTILQNTDFYVGIMDRNEAKDCLMNMKIKGLYLLRMKHCKRQLRLSLLTGENADDFRVVHIEVSVIDKKFRLGDGTDSRTPKEMIEVYKLSGEKLFKFLIPFTL